MKLQKYFKKHCKKENKVPDKVQLHLLELLQQYKDLLEDKFSLISKLTRLFTKKSPAKKQGVYIYGKVGRGKSMIMDLFYNKLDITSKRKIHFHQFMLEIHAQLHKLRNNYKDPLAELANRTAKQYTVICLDELQVNNVADAMIIARLFISLLKNNVFVLMTSNRIPDDLFKDGLQREHFEPFIELINTLFEVYNLDINIDYRAQKKASIEQVFFNLSKKGEKQKFNTWLNKQLGIRFNKNMQLIVDNERMLLIPKSSETIAVFDFTDLCVKSRGSSDYIAICKQFKNIVITNIPKMSKNNYNEALRFITLIDCLYEHQIKLVYSAFNEPDDIYHGDINNFEFNRTASRLKEMKSTEYIQKISL